MNSFEEKEIERVMESRLQAIEMKYDSMLSQVRERLAAVQEVLNDFNEMVAQKKLVEIEDKYQELMMDKGLKMLLEMYKLMSMPPEDLQRALSYVQKTKELQILD